MTMTAMTYMKVRTNFFSGRGVYFELYSSFLVTYISINQTQNVKHLRQTHFLTKGESYELILGKRDCFAQRPALLLLFFRTVENLSI